MNIIICDMIKRNESDVGHIIFEILLCFILFLAPVFSIGKFFITSSVPDIQLLWDLNQNEA